MPDSYARAARREVYPMRWRKQIPNHLFPITDQSGARRELQVYDFRKLGTASILGLDDRQNPISYRDGRFSAYPDRVTSDLVRAIEQLGSVKKLTIAAGLVVLDLDNDLLSWRMHDSKIRQLLTKLVRCRGLQPVRYDVTPDALATQSLRDSTEFQACVN